MPRTYKPKVRIENAKNPEINARLGEVCAFTRIDVDSRYAYAVVTNPRGQEIRMPVKIFEEYFVFHSNNIEAD